MAWATLSIPPFSRQFARLALIDLMSFQNAIISFDLAPCF
jgi:hypothetical protein